MLYIAIKTPKIDILKNVCSYSECSSLIHCAFFFTKFWVCYRFSKGPFFEILYKGEQCNDDILSIMLHNSTIWCQMMAILASFDIKEAVFQPILCFCITGDKFIVQSESKRRGENLKHKKSLFNAGHEC